MNDLRTRPTALRNFGRALALMALAAGASGWVACGGSKGSSGDASVGDVSSDTSLGRGGGAAGGKLGGTGGKVGTGGQVATGGVVGNGGKTGSVGGSTGSGVAKTQCNDGLDNDGDGKIDLADPECVSPLDNDESSFATGIPGDNIDACKQDCFFDGNSGMGDDHCEWQLKCDPANVGATAEKKCEYDPSYSNCPATQAKACIDYCRPLTPNGCDCFGCCQVNTASGIRSVRLTPTCTAAKFDDPTACAPCTQNPSCNNDCKPCELCLGKTTLPPECYGVGGAGGGTGAGGMSGGIECLNAVVCGTDQSICDKTGTICISGCCVSGPS
ncbi:MAG TPA: hypothetical protein VHU40_08290 [Polyangia bacterium]|nr:hypothetical protein [Polyangia bacterium]